MSFILPGEIRAFAPSEFDPLCDEELSRYLGVAAAIFYGLTSRELGCVISDVLQDGDDVLLTVYGHLLLGTGTIHITGTSTALDGEQGYSVVDGETLRIADIAAGDVTLGGKLFRKHTRDFQPLEDVVTLAPSPIYKIVDLRLEYAFPQDATQAFGDSTVVNASDYYVIPAGDPVRRGDIAIRTGLTKPLHVRRPGFIRPQRTNARPTVRATWYAGLNEAVPPDLVSALAEVAKQVYLDPGGSEFSSESLDYYSYSRRGAAEQLGLPTTALSTMMRYR